MKKLSSYLFLFSLFCNFSFADKLLEASELESNFLVAKPHMPDPRFQESVIYILYHNEEGAAGLVVNKPIETMPISKLFKSSNLTPPENMIQKQIILYWGGPVEPEHIFFVHSPDYKSNDSISSNNYFTITREPKVLFDIAEDKGPKKYLILSGVAVWSPGQLDNEIMRGDWQKKSNSYIPLFDNGSEMWSRLISSHDI